MTTPTPTEPRAIYFGGQAVLEGVMIRGPRHMAVSVRHPAGQPPEHGQQQYEPAPDAFDPATPIGQAWSRS